MAGRVYHPTDLLEINWSDLDGVEFRRREGPGPQEGLPVREEIVEDDAGVISSVVVPDFAPSGGGRDGRGVFGGVPGQLTTVSRVHFVYHYYRPYE